VIPHVDLRIESCEAEIWLNDFPIHRTVATDIPKLLTKPVAEFVHNGDNILTVIPFPGMTPSTSREPRLVSPSPAAKIEAKLVFYEPGDFPGSGDGRDMMVAVFKAGESALSMPTQTIVEKCSLKIGIGPWAWQRSQRLSLTPELRETIVKAVKRAHKAFAECDAEFFLKAGQLYFAEYAHAYLGMTAEIREKRFRAGFATCLGDPEWRIAPLDEDAFDFRLCADGRLVELIDREFRPILRAESKDYPLQLFLGFLDGRWQILR